MIEFIIGVAVVCVICFILSIITGDDWLANVASGGFGCLGGLIGIVISIAIISGAFAINPILGIIVLYFVIQCWKSN